MLSNVSLVFLLLDGQVIFIFILDEQVTKKQKYEYKEFKDFKTVNGLQRIHTQQ
jgi:hypothetical protein